MGDAQTIAITFSRLRAKFVEPVIFKRVKWEDSHWFKVWLKLARGEEI